jgi:hypothetical protein
MFVQQTGNRSQRVNCITSTLSCAPPLSLTFHQKSDTRISGIAIRQELASITSLLPEFTILDRINGNLDPKKHTTPFIKTEATL